VTRNVDEHNSAISTRHIPIMNAICRWISNVHEKLPQMLQGRQLKLQSQLGKYDIPCYIYNRVS
jgi:hypothetical protein